MIWQSILLIQYLSSRNSVDRNGMETLTAQMTIEMSLRMSVLNSRITKEIAAQLIHRCKINASTVQL